VAFGAAVISFENSMKTRLLNTCNGLVVAAILVGVVLSGAALTCIAQAVSNATSQPVNSGSAALTQAQIDEVIRAFTRKETAYRQALNLYAFKRDALVQTIGMGGQVTGEYHRVSLFTFDDAGTRFEKINFFPMPTLTEISITEQDLEDLGGVNPFALEASKLGAYSFKYVGKEKIDELDLYVFDVAPKVAPDPKKVKERFFQGRIWVDTQDLQIVKAKGKGVPEDKNNKYPTFETYREQIDGKYWFPTYTYADDELVFGNGNVVRIRELVKYSDFVQGHGKVTITEVGDAPPDTVRPDPSPQPSPTPQGQRQEPPAEPKDVQPVEGGIVNGKAIELPAPKYPAEAKKAHAAGEVQVKVLIDRTGKVLSAEVIFGPDVFREVSVEAAKRAKFTPTLLAGVPVKVSGIIIYRFVAQ
jgi:TonB family protein